MARSRNHCCEGNATMRPLCIVNHTRHCQLYKNIESVVMETQQCVLFFIVVPHVPIDNIQILHCCQGNSNVGPVYIVVQPTQFLVPVNNINVLKSFVRF